MSHDQPTYANLPGIRVFGMKCVAPSVASLPQRKKPVSQHHRIPPKPQSSYQYQHRPDGIVHASELPQHIQHHGQGSLGALTNGYGRSADKNVEAESETTTTGEQVETTTMFTDADEEEGAMETMTEAARRHMRSMSLQEEEAEEKEEQSESRASVDNYVEPEFPWHKVLELQEALRWNTADN